MHERKHSGTEAVETTKETIDTIGDYLRKLDRPGEANLYGLVSALEIIESQAKAAGLILDKYPNALRPEHHENNTPEDLTTLLKSLELDNEHTDTETLRLLANVRAYSLVALSNIARSSDSLKTSTDEEYAYLKRRLGGYAERLRHSFGEHLEVASQDLLQ